MISTSDWIQIFVGAGAWSAALIAMVLGLLSYRDRVSRDEAEGLLLAYQITSDLKKCIDGLGRAEDIRRLLRATSNEGVERNAQALLKDLSLPLVRHNIARLHLLPGGIGLEVAKAIPMIDEINQMVREARELRAPHSKDGAAVEISKLAKQAKEHLESALDKVTPSGASAVGD